MPNDLITVVRHRNRRQLSVACLRHRCSAPESDGKPIKNIVNIAVRFPVADDVAEIVKMPVRQHSTILLAIDRQSTHNPLCRPRGTRRFNPTPLPGFRLPLYPGLSSHALRAWFAMKRAMCERKHSLHLNKKQVPLRLHSGFRLRARTPANRLNFASLRMTGGVLAAGGWYLFLARPQTAVTSLYQHDKSNRPPARQRWHVSGQNRYTLFK